MLIMIKEIFVTFRLHSKLLCFIPAKCTLYLMERASQLSKTHQFER